VQRLHYSTVAQSEMRDGIAKIISLAGVREAMALELMALQKGQGQGQGQGQGGGIEVVSIVEKNETARSGSHPNWPILLSFSCGR
jgi:hypothetical protein